jgi:RNA-binding protein
MTLTLKGSQRKYLRGLAHGLKPVILIGLKGATEPVAGALEEALAHHELVKIKFIETKDKADKSRMIDDLQRLTGAQLVGTLGHTAILYRAHPDPEKRKITLPA